MVQPMSEPGDFVIVPLNLTVRDSVTQIEKITSKCGTSIQSRTALSVGEMENLATDQMEAVQLREHSDTREFLSTGTSSRRRCQYQEGKEGDWYSTGHGSHTPLQDDGHKPMTDLAQSLHTMYSHTLTDVQTWCVLAQNWCEHIAASICADEEELTVAQRPSWCSDTYPEQKQEQQKKQTVVGDREHRDGCTN